MLKKKKISFGVELSFFIFVPLLVLVIFSCLSNYNLATNVKNKSII